MASKTLCSMLLPQWALGKVTKLNPLSNHLHTKTK